MYPKLYTSQTLDPERYTQNPKPYLSKEDAVDGNPFASGGNQGAGAVDSESKPSGGGGGFKVNPPSAF
jgi:hypothetical protein